MLLLFWFFLLFRITKICIQVKSDCIGVGAGVVFCVEMIDMRVILIPFYLSQKLWIIKMRVIWEHDGNFLRCMPFLALLQKFQQFRFSWKGVRHLCRKKWVSDENSYLIEWHIATTGWKTLNLLLINILLWENTKLLILHRLNEITITGLLRLSYIQAKYTFTLLSWL